MVDTAQRSTHGLRTALLCAVSFGLGVMLSQIATTSWDVPHLPRVRREWPSNAAFLAQTPQPVVMGSAGSDHVHNSGRRPPDLKVGSFVAGTKGVVVSVHHGIVSMGASLIRELRCLGFDEPIQVYHCFDELTKSDQALLQRNDSSVEIIDVCDALMKHDNGSFFGGDRGLAKSFQSYWIKPLAVYYTHFEEPILLDADAILLRNPSDLRAIDGYKRTGTIFFYDRIVKMNGFFNKKISNGKTLLHQIIETFDYANFGLKGPKPSVQLQQSFAYRALTAHEQDSSMVFIKKSGSETALEILRHIALFLRKKQRFSWGDKEAFWLSYELAQQPYYFSPWALSLVDSVPNQDMKKHPNTLCGSMAHYMPTSNSSHAPEIMYVNGKALLEPFPLGSVEKTKKAPPSRLFNVRPTYVSPRRNRSELQPFSSDKFECMHNLGSVKLPDYFFSNLQRRRMHYFAIETHYLPPLDRCQ